MGVEHLVTEMISSIDIVEMQINIANNLHIRQNNSIFKFYGHSINVRIYAETPDYNFFPCTGTINFLHLPGGPNVRIDAGIINGSKITSYYDPMLMKISSWGKTRIYSIRTLLTTLEELILNGCITNISFLLT